MCIFYDTKYILLLKMLLESLYYSNDTTLFTIIIYTSSLFKNQIIEVCETKNIQFIINDTIKNKTQACLSRLDIFDIIKNTHSCTTILYIDIDVLIQKSLLPLFDKCVDKKIYALQEGTIDHTFYGKELFDCMLSFFTDQRAFSSGILLFPNCIEIEILFQDIKRDVAYNTNNLLFYDQPYIVFHSKINNVIDNEVLQHDIVTNCIEYNDKYTLIHFCGGVNVNIDKILHMKQYHNHLTSSLMFRK
jgi:lipopolysaccharide biosynthesis glycosyltransferase